MADSGLFLDRVTISLGPRVLVALTHRVAPGEVLTVMGPSGSGKSTLLAYVGGFLDRAFAASGTVSVDGADLTALAAEDRHAGILFQDPLLFPHLSVGGNLLFAIPHSVKGRVARRAMAEQSQVDAIYFQGAVLDPMDCLEQMERELNLPVVASNPAMNWYMLSKLGLKHPRTGYGKLLSSWPPLPDGY